MPSHTCNATLIHAVKLFCASKTCHHAVRSFAWSPCLLAAKNVCDVRPTLLALEAMSEVGKAQRTLDACCCFKVGVIRLSGFNARAQQDVSQAVKALTRQGASEFTLDVRDNRGGLYQEGAEVAKLFLEGCCCYLPFMHGIED